MTADEVERLLSSAAYDAGLALFKAYDVALEPAGLAALRKDDLTLLSIIGFAGRQVCGTLVLGATEEPLSRSVPHGASVRGWIGELANQLLGRVKNTAMRNGIEFYAMPPAVVSGQHLTPVTKRPDFQPVVFATKAGNVCLWIEVAAAERLQPDPALREAEIPAEGDLILF